MFSVFIDHPKRFEKQMRVLPEFMQRKVAAVIEQLAQFPKVQQIKKLSNGGYRIRVGDYRVLFDVDEGKGLILVYGVGHRRDIYR